MKIRKLTIDEELISVAGMVAGMIQGLAGRLGEQEKADVFIKEINQRLIKIRDLAKNKGDK